MFKQLPNNYLDLNKFRLFLRGDRLTRSSLSVGSYLCPKDVGEPPWITGFVVSVRDLFGNRRSAEIGTMSRKNDTGSKWSRFRKGVKVWRELDKIITIRHQYLS